MAVPAGPDELSGIKRLAGAHRTELGWVRETALRASMEKGELWCVRAVSGEILGFVQFHHRRDGITKIYAVCVVPVARKKGVGRMLISLVKEEARKAGQHAVSLKAPEDLRANDFYPRVGFEDRGLEPGKKRRLRIWVLTLQS
jgi:ribosomal protein S18 acetylase RimI-like enzyme